MIRALRHDRRGVAALELALVAPVLLAMFGSLTDFTLALSDRMQIAGAVAGGAQYAFNQGQLLAGSQQSVSAADVQSKVQGGTNLPGVAVAVTGPALYCLASATLTADKAGTKCANGSAPGTYVIITASYPYTPMLPLYSMMASKTLSETASVRLY